jgi:predicted RNA-binding protein with RPS1 domain
MVKKEMRSNRLLVLDTNVLMHDPTALFRFQEHDIFLPMVVLEELDRSKKGVSEVARNVRQVSRFIDELTQDATHAQITQGLPLHPPSLAESALNATGRLFFQTRAMVAHLPESLPGSTPDNTILATALALQGEQPDANITLVSKDINLRIKAAVLGLHAEDYFNDQVLDDVSLLYSGMVELPADFWESHGREMESWQESGRTYYRVTGPLVMQWQPNQFLYRDGDNPVQAIVLEIDKDNERFSLGVKQLNADPWNTVAQRYDVGKEITGTVTNVTDFGVFVELEEGIEGLVHVSEISKEKIKTPVGMFNVGDNIKARVMNINGEERRIGLSIKRLEMENDHELLSDYVSNMGPATSSFGELLRENLQEKLNEE